MPALVRQYLPSPIMTRSARSHTAYLLPANEAVERTATREPLHTNAVRNKTAEILPFLVILLAELREAVFAGDVDLLASWEFELGATEGLDGDGALLVLSTDRHQHLSNVASSSCAVALAPCPTHAGLQAIGACA